MMETFIEHMEVHFDVEGDDSEVFARLFRQHIEAWTRAQRERQRNAERSRRDRTIGSGQRRWGGDT